MPRPGPKTKSADVVAIRGTEQACRPRESAPEPTGQEIVKPKWLIGQAAKSWAEKVAIFQGRGQEIAGSEMALAQYCAVEAGLIDCYRKKIQPTTAMVREHRMWAAEFYDTPASQVGRPSKKPDANPFGRNGKRP